jgi:hypothetical protein
MAVSRKTIEANLRTIRENIAAACRRARRQPDTVRLVAVTKAVNLDTVRALLAAGVTDLGENRVKQLTARAAELAEPARRRVADARSEVRWHMVGHLQRNKVRPVVDLGATIHSVDSLRLAEEINARSEQRGAVTDVLLEVNCSGEGQKFGVAVGAALPLADLLASMKHLRLLGLMTMAPLVADPEQARLTFARLREIFEEARHERVGGAAFCHLSMGMSQDYTVAVEEGATLLRIGTAVFQE